MSRFKSSAFKLIDFDDAMETSNTDGLLSGKTLAVNRSNTDQTVTCNEFDRQFSEVFSPSWCLQPYTAFDVEKQLWLPGHFRDESSVDILEATEGDGSWIKSADDSEIHRAVERALNPEYKTQHRVLAFFIGLFTETESPTTYGCRSSISSKTLKSLIRDLEIGEAFLPEIIGRPDYWAPFVLPNKDRGTYEFHCQHPRWAKPTNWQKQKLQQRGPSSVYMKHFCHANLTLYLVPGADTDDCLTFLRESLDPQTTPLYKHRIASIANGNPFMLHAIMSSIIVEQSKEYVHDVRNTLMKTINEVNDYSEQDSGEQSGNDTNGRTRRAKLEAITKQFHIISQKADTGIANCEKAVENCEYILKEYGDMESSINELPTNSAATNMMEASMRYSLNVWHCQKRLLVIYKSRKETSMNLVFNMVTQQDSSVNVRIAEKTMQDSASMKTIALLTMVFLPGTFLSAVFSSGIFREGGIGEGYTMSDLFYPYMLTIFPLTLGVLVLWATRGIIRKMSLHLAKCGGSIKWSNVRTSRKRADLESGIKKE